MYSFGILLSEVYTGRDPYDGQDAMEVLRLVVDPTVEKRPDVKPGSLPAPISLLMRECWQSLPELRPPFEEIDRRLNAMDTELTSVNRDRKSRASKREAQASSVLNNVFPAYVAEALKEGRKVEPEHRDIVTIFFSDIVGYTAIASGMHPAKLADMLDRLYTKLDELSEKHNIFKVETIGDAYMAVTNLVQDQEFDHTKRIADFAMDAIVAASSTLIDEEDVSLGTVSLRIGFHSGPVVANVIGSLNPRYCLFGDTVNTASRMESESLPGEDPLLRPRGGAAGAAGARHPAPLARAHPREGQGRDEDILGQRDDGDDAGQEDAAHWRAFPTLRPWVGGGRHRERGGRHRGARGGG